MTLHIRILHSTLVIYKCLDSIQSSKVCLKWSHFLRGQTQKFLGRFKFNWLLQHSYKLASKQNRSLLPKLIMIIIIWTHRWNMNWILKYFVEWIWTCCYMLWYELKAILIVCQLHASFYTISIIWCAHFVTSPITLYLYSTSLLLTILTEQYTVKWKSLVKIL